jgi:ELWxxDGT repeat protein
MTRRLRRQQGSSVEILERRALLSAVLVADVQQGSADSSPAFFTAGPRRLFFRATDNPRVGPGSPGAGNEPYLTDGTAAGTAMLKDVNPQGDSYFEPGATIPKPQTGLAAAVPGAPGDAFFFSAYVGEGVYGYELWYTDGTAAGTHLVKDIWPGFQGSNPADMVVVGDTVYFSAETVLQRRDLWRSDGTEAGTLPVVDSAGHTLARATAVAALDGVVYATNTSGLWRLGPDKAELIKQLAGTTSGARDLTAFNGALYFKAGSQLWRSDGTAAGTIAVSNIGNTFTSNAFDGMVASGGALYFVGNAPDTGFELWRSDGTAAGTAPVKDLNPGTGSSLPTRLVDAGGTLYFTASVPGMGTGLWKTDGTADGTVPLRMVADDATVRPIGELVAVGNTVFFTVAAPASEPGLWASDGTPGGTRRVSSVQEPKNLAAFNGMLVFSGKSIYGSEPWKSDGTPEGTVQLADIDTRPAVNLAGPDGLYAVNGRVAWTEDDGVTGRKLWSSDGTAAGTVALGNYPGSVSAAPFRAVRLGDRLYFTYGTTGNELWSTDGMPGGTRLVATFTDHPLSQSPTIENLSSAGGRLFFFADDPQFGKEPYTSDGTPQGTVLLKDISPGTQRSVPAPDFRRQRFVEAGGEVFFALFSGGAYSLWKTDGTPDGTAVLGTFSAFPDWLTPLGDKVVFSTASSGTAAEEVWITDGTPAGTTPLKTDLLGQSFTPVGNALVFWGGGGLWRTDGTVDGTYALKPFSGTFSNPGSMTPYNGQVFFRTDQGAWKTDGTAEGTVQLRTADGALVRGPGIDRFFPFDGKLFFSGSAAGGNTGSELWRTDGTPAGTTLVQDIWPGATSSSPGSTTSSTPGTVALGSSLYFFADDGVHGRELWKYTPDVPVVVTSRQVFYNNSAFDGRDPAATAADLGAIAPDKTAMVPGAAASFANVTSYLKGINGVLVGFAGMPPATLTADDFDLRVSTDPAGNAWTAAPAPAAVVLLPDPTGANIARYALTWPDGAIRNTWLKVTVKANERTGLAMSDEFYFGNLVGETGDGAGAPLFMRVTALDLAATRQKLFSAAPVSAATDFNRDGKVNALDLAILRGSFARTLPLWAVPIPIAGASAADAATITASSILKDDQA